MKRIGIFGGTFDPVHNGHLAAAQAARERLGLDRVIFVPAGRPPHKPGRALTPAKHRLAMVGLAIRGNAGFVLSADEIARPDTSFTVDTLERLASRLGKCKLHLLIGMDQALQLDTWRRPERIFALAEVDVVSRPGYREEGIPSRWRKRLRSVETPGLEISSRLIRRWARQGRSIAYLVPDPVSRYIRRHGLYRRGGQAVGKEADGGG